jgi:hypothetical protein
MIGSILQFLMSAQAGHDATKGARDYARFPATETRRRQNIREQLDARDSMTAPDSEQPDWAKSWSGAGRVAKEFAQKLQEFDRERTRQGNRPNTNATGAASFDEAGFTTPTEARPATRALRLPDAFPPMQGLDLPGIPQAPAMTPMAPTDMTQDAGPAAPQPMAQDAMGLDLMPGTLASKPARPRVHNLPRPAAYVPAGEPPQAPRPEPTPAPFQAPSWFQRNADLQRDPSTGAYLNPELAKRAEALPSPFAKLFGG